MFLKHLTLFGFKSFADKTEIEFADGITALLGPNGCGKSNVVDAVKWVLGEHASKSLRAEKMEDVIFNGTESRKALGVAEVTLTLANDAGLLPLDTPEVEIKRRLYRSGESEYFIDGVQKRLKDIRELFWDTGVGKAAYSVMEQGKIDQVLSSKPDERRYLFEEAAGITSVKEREAGAARDLAKAEENLRQLAPTLAEVKRSYDTLKVQAEKALKFRALKEDIFYFEVDIQLLKLKQFKYNRDERNETFKRRTIDRDRLRSEKEAENKVLETLMDELNFMEARFVELQNNQIVLGKEKIASENEVRLLAEQRNESKIKIAQNESREKLIGLKIEELSDDADDQDGAVRDLRKKAGDIADNIRSFDENIQLAAARIGDNEEGVRRAEEEIHGLEKAQTGFEQDLAMITDDIVAELDAGLKKAGYSAPERRNIEAALNETLGRLHTILSGRETLLRDLAAAVSAQAEVGAGPDAAEIKRVADSLAASLAEAARDAGTARALFESYREHSASFIDEFLAPEGIITKKRSLDARIRGAKDDIEERRKRISALRGDNAELGAKIDEYRVTLQDLRVNQAQMQAQAQAAEEQARLIRRELAGQEGQLKTVRDELFLDRKKLGEIDERIACTETEIAEIEQKGVKLTAELETLEKDTRKRSGDVEGKREVIEKRTAELARVEESLEKLSLELVQSETEIKNIQDNFRESHSRDLMEFEERMFKITATPPDLREKHSQARAQMRDLGSVNLMAPEEFTETKARYELLSNQVADCEETRKKLEDIAQEIRQKSSELFIATYNRIKKNFHNMFRRLFGGGRAELRLSDSNHVLESGIEIFAQPPGKKLEHITLLSGGERSMTAVALLFATYMVKPSPFCLLDEIDAALDPANVARFVNLLREFGGASQFIIITHNNKTVTGAGTLLGVTMEEAGITKLISMRIVNEDSHGQEPPQQGLWEEESFKEEDVEIEEGRELPAGVDDPGTVSDAQLHPIRGTRPPR